MASKRQVDAYRRRLARVQLGTDINAEAIGAVFTGVVDGDWDTEATGTIVAVMHELGWGLFGPITNTKVKLCSACVHESGGSRCEAPADLEWVSVAAVLHLRRNGDGPPEGNEDE